jgi:hypothetical protein
MEKAPRNDRYGEVRGDVEVQTSKVATYESLTMNAVRPRD